MLGFLIVFALSVITADALFMLAVCLFCMEDDDDK